MDVNAYKISGRRSVSGFSRLVTETGGLSTTEPEMEEETKMERRVNARMTRMGCPVPQENHI